MIGVNLPLVPMGRVNVGWTPRSAVVGIQVKEPWWEMGRRSRLVRLCVPFAKIEVSWAEKRKASS